MTHVCSLAHYLSQGKHTINCYAGTIHSIFKCPAGLCPHAPFTPIRKHRIWKVAVIRSHVLNPCAEFQSSRPSHLLLHANYVLFLFEYLLQIYKASVIILAPGSTESGREVYKQKTHAGPHTHTHNPPCHGKENKPRAS